MILRSARRHRPGLHAHDRDQRGRHRVQRVRAVRVGWPGSHGRHARDGTRLAHLAVHSPAVRGDAPRHGADRCGRASRLKGKGDRTWRRPHRSARRAIAACESRSRPRARCQRSPQSGRCLQPRIPRQRPLATHSRRWRKRSHANEHARAHRNGRPDRTRLSRRCGADVVSRCIGTTRGLLGRALQSRRGRAQERTLARTVARCRVDRGRSSGFADVTDRRVDIICGADEVTLANRAQASFSIPVFPGGVSALVRTDAPMPRSSDALEERPAPYEPLWRGTAAADARASHVFGARRLRTMEALKEQRRETAPEGERRSQ